MWVVSGSAEGGESGFGVDQFQRRLNWDTNSGDEGGVKGRITQRRHEREFALFSSNKGDARTGGERTLEERPTRLS